MNKLEDKLKNIRLRELNDDDKASIWNAVLLKHLNLVNNPETFSYISIFNFQIRKFAFVMMALFLLVFGGGAGIIKASDDAIPGSKLFPLDLAVESFQIKVAAPEEKDKLRLKFAEERVVEVKTLSAAKATTVLVQASEDSTPSEVNTIDFSKEENAGVEVALNNLTKLVEDSDDKESAETIEKAQKELLVILGDDANLVVKRVNGVITLDGKDKIPEETEVKTEDEIKENNVDATIEEPINIEDKTEVTEEDVNNLNTETNLSSTEEVVPVTEEVKTENTIEAKSASLLSLPSPAEEVFCRGEWRPSLDCDLKVEVKNDEGEIKGTIDEMGPESEIPTDMDIKVQAERARNCTDSGGIYDLSYDECLGVDGAMCTSIGGTWNECASACRNNPQASVCTMQCVQVCEFK